MVQFLERNCEARPPVWNWSLWKWKQVTEAEEVLLGSKGRDDLRNSSNNPPPPLLKLFWNNFSTIPQEFTSAYHRQQIWSVPRKICQQILFRKKHCKNCEYCPSPQGLQWMLWLLFSIVRWYVMCVLIVTSLLDCLCLCTDPGWPVLFFPFVKICPYGHGLRW